MGWRFALLSLSYFSKIYNENEITNYFILIGYLKTGGGGGGIQANPLNPLGSATQHA